MKWLVATASGVPGGDVNISVRVSAHDHLPTKGSTGVSFDDPPHVVDASAAKTTAAIGRSLIVFLRGQAKARSNVPVGPARASSQLRNRSPRIFTASTNESGHTDRVDP